MRFSNQLLRCIEGISEPTPLSSQKQRLDAIGVDVF